jgi:RimJ/RimL family protein N-acetyltransferase
MIGADIHPSHRRRGHAFEAYQILLDHLFNTEKFNKVSLEVLDFNDKAIALYEKLGFVREGVKREEIICGQERYDSVIMSILKSEFKSWVLRQQQRRSND